MRQVRFNAWHYSDDHLWVGIIEHLFRELADPKHDVDDNDRANIQTELESEHNNLRRLDQRIHAIEEVPVGTGWFGRLLQPFRLARLLKAVGADMWEEVRAPRRLLLGLGLILVGTALVIGATWLDQGLVAWIAGIVAGLTGLIGSVAQVWRHTDEAANKAHRKLQQRREQTEAKVRRLENQLDLVDPARRLESLLTAIGSSERYERYRGLTGRIRYDLDQLSSDLAAAQEKWAAGDSKTAPPVQRIVLY